MASHPRPRPARQPAWRPGQQPEVHPARRWLVRMGWTAAAVALVALFVWLLWSPAPGERSTFAVLSIDAYDPGELPPPAFSQTDRTDLASLSWRNQLDLGEPLRAAEKLRGWNGEADTFVCYVSAHVAVRPLKEEVRTCLLTPDFRRSALDDLLSDDVSSSRVDMRDLLAALKQLKAQTKLLLIDAPHTHAEPWLTALEAGWSDALSADVRAVADENLYVVVAGEPRGVSRTDHHVRRSQFVEAVSAVLTGTGDSDQDGEIDLADLRTRVTEMTGQAPFIVHAQGVAEDRRVLERPLRQLLAAKGEPDTPPPSDAKTPKDDKDTKVALVDPVTLAWQTRDTLTDVDQKLAVGPVDYAPDAWRKLQAIMVWHDWTLHTGGHARRDAPFEELVLAQASLAMDPQAGLAPFRNAALAPFRGAIDRFSPSLAAWRDAPAGYRFAARRRNLLLARVPEYWRWKAACGALDEGQSEADLQAVFALSSAISAGGAQGDRAAAAELEAQARRDPIESLLRRVTVGVSEEVNALCDRKATRGKIAPLEAGTQRTIEQLLLTSLPSAADRARLWKTLADSEAAPGPLVRPSQETVAQARLEATLAQSLARLAEDAALADRENIATLSQELDASAKQLAATNNASAGLEFAACFSAFQEQLVASAPARPASPAEELLARAADVMVERSADSGTVSPLPAWRTRLDVAIDQPTVDLSSAASAPVVVTLRTDDEKNVPILRFDEVPSMLRLEHAGKPLVAGMVINGSRFELMFSTPLGVSDQAEAVVRGAASVLASNGQVETRPVEIHVKLPQENRYELAALGASQLVKRDAAAMTLLAIPRQLTSYALGIQQTAGAPRPLRAALYAVDALPEAQSLPTTFEELESIGRKLDVQVEIGADGDVRPLKFLPPPPAPPATPPATVAPPTADPNAPIPLATPRLAVVLDQLDGEAIMRRHLLWLNLEPLHPDRFVATPTPRIVSNFGLQKIEVPIAAKSSVEGEVAVPREGVPYELAGSAAFKDADFQLGVGRLTRDRTITAKVDIPEDLPDAADARLFLNVSAYPRAFMWRVRPDDGAIEPFRGPRIAIRRPLPMPAGEPPLSQQPNRPIDLEIEADNDDPDSAVRIELRMLGEDGFPLDSPESLVTSQTWRGTRSIQNELRLDPKTGRLGVRTEVTDFAIPLDPAGSQGRAEIIARIEGRDGKVAEDRLPIILDGTPPEVRELAQGYDLPLEHAPDKPLTFAMAVSDRLSGPKALLYWIGSKPRRTETGEWNPPGLEARLDTILSDADAFEDREFLITLEKVPEAPPGRLGSLRFFFIASDNAGNVMDEPRPFDVQYATQVMDDKDAKGKPRDILVKVNYRRGNGTAICRDAKVELMPPGGMAAIKTASGNAQGEATLRQVMPGEYTVKASGTTNNMPGKGEQAIQVPETGEGPIRVNITLQ